MFELTTTIGGITLKNPVMPASGPLVSDAGKMLAIAALGVGAMVTKTISTAAAEVPRPCIYGARDLVMNTELWSEHPPRVWLDDILPRVKPKLEVPLWISVGYSRDDMAQLIPRLDPYADAFEISTHYVGKDLAVIAETVRTIRAHTAKPFFMKISPHLPDPAGFARMVRDNGGDGIVAVNSLGPTMKIDLYRRRVVLGNQAGQAWTSGPVIKPLALAVVHLIKQATPELAVIGVGGIKNAEDVLEFLLAGADGVQMLSGAMLYGKDLYRQLVENLPQALQKYGFSSVKQVINAGLQQEPLSYLPNVPTVTASKCTGCRLCEKICPYFAIEYAGRVRIDSAKCFGCGLCETRCPAEAIRGLYRPVAG